MRILVVDDDNFIAKALTEVLSSQNYAVEVASDGQAGWDLIQAFAYDLIVLDVMLPKLDGISLCRRLRESGYQTPVLLLTGRNTGHDKAIGLDAGADDYLVKPFDLEELFARVRALLRRGTSTSPPILEWENLRLNPSSCEVFYGTQPVNLTPKEYALLELFLRNSGRVFSCNAILDNIWSFDKTPGEEAVRTQIKGLRQKLKAVDAPADMIDTVYGIGYRLKPIDVKPQLASETTKEVTTQQTRTAIAGVWQRFKGRISDQVEVIAATAANLRQDKIDIELQAKAEREAHTLAGSLGTFGLKAGSEIAREIEGILRSPIKDIARLEVLAIALRQEIERSPTPPASPTAAPPSPQQRPLLTSAKVMVVDDDPQILATVKELLEPWGIIVTTLDKPQRFWQTLSAFTPELLILDINMPQLSGIELCQSVKSDPQWSKLPIIFLTAQADQSAINQVLAVGGDDFVSKPIVGAELVVRIVNRLEQLKRQRQENNGR